MCYEEKYSIGVHIQMFMMQDRKVNNLSYGKGPLCPSPKKGTLLLSPQLKQGVLRGGLITVPLLLASLGRRVSETLFSDSNGKTSEGLTSSSEEMMRSVKKFSTTKGDTYAKNHPIFVV
jgi:hypothetical protein